MKTFVTPFRVGLLVVAAIGFLLAFLVFVRRGTMGAETITVYAMFRDASGLGTRSRVQVAGIPVSKFLDDEKLKAIESRTRKAGGEVVGLLGFGSAFVSPAWAALEMAEAIIYDKRKVIPVCALLEGEYGVKDLYMGVPCIVGKNGIEKVIQLDLTEEEKAAFAKSAAGVRKTCDEAEGMLKK